VIGNVTELCPAATVAVAGTVAALVFELVSPTDTPPENAFPVSDTVPVTSPPEVAVGESETELTNGGSIESVALVAVEPGLPVIATLVVDATGVAFIENDVLFAPNGTVT